MKLKDKVAYITGAASGIGKEIAIVFAREGARIVIADLNQAAAEATATELKSSGAQAVGIAVDDRSVAQEADTRPRCSNESGHGSLVNSNRIFRAVNSSPPSTAAASCLTASFTRPLSLEPFLPNMIFGCAVLSTRAGS